MGVNFTARMYSFFTDEEVDVASSMKLILDAFLQNLPNCVNRELIDKVNRIITCITSAGVCEKSEWLKAFARRLPKFSFTEPSAGRHKM